MHRSALVLIIVALGCGTDDPSLTTSSDGSSAGDTAASGTTDGLSQTGAAEGNPVTTAAGTTQGADDTAGATTSPTSDGATTDATTTAEGSTTDPTNGASDGPVTTGDPMCGDGQIAPGEQCDGADLQGFDCSSLGLGEGTLSCDSVTCTFDTSMCMQGGGGTGFAGM